MNVKNRIDPFRFVAPTPSSVCLIGEGGEGGEGGGGGGDEGGEGGEGDKKKALDDETKRFIANTVNSAVAGHLKRDSFRETIQQTVQQTVTESIQGALKDFRPGGGEGGDDPEKGRSGGGGRNGKPDPRDQELARLKSEQEKLQAKIKKQEAEAEKERKDARMATERSKLSESLRAAGVDDSRVKAAVAYLYLDQGRIKRDEKDRICMTFERDWGEELVPVEKGVVEYLKTDEGKLFLPPVETAGSGNRGGRAPRRKPGEKPSRGELMNHLGNLMLGGGKPPGQ